MAVASLEIESDGLLEQYGREFSAGERLFEDGHRAKEAFLLKTGRIRCIKTFGSTERNLRVVRAGELLGEAALVPRAHHTSTAIALTDGSALALSAETLGQVLQTNTALAARLLEQLARRLRDADSQLEVLMMGDSQIKVVVALIQLAQDAAGGQNATAFSISPLELSARVGLDVETVKRNVAQLRTNEYLTIADERIEVPSVDALKELKGLLDVKGSIVGGDVAKR